MGVFFLYRMPGLHEREGLKEKTSDDRREGGFGCWVKRRTGDKEKMANVECRILNGQ